MLYIEILLPPTRFLRVEGSVAIFASAKNFAILNRLLFVIQMMPKLSPGLVILLSWTFIIGDSQETATVVEQGGTSKCTRFQ